MTTARPTRPSIEDFARTPPFPVQIHRDKQRLCYVDNFLKAASLCEGDYIAFCDQEDVWLPEKLSVFAEIISKNPNSFVVHFAQMVDQNFNSLEILHPRIERFNVTAPLSGDP